MQTTSGAGTRVATFLATVALSATTMMWLFWRHPLTTTLASLAVLTALAVAARLARSLDGEPGVGGAQDGGISS